VHDRTPSSKGFSKTSIPVFALVKDAPFAQCDSKSWVSLSSKSWNLTLLGYNILKIKNPANLCELRDKGKV